MSGKPKQRAWRSGVAPSCRLGGEAVRLAGGRPRSVGCRYACMMRIWPSATRFAALLSIDANKQQR